MRRFGLIIAFIAKSFRSYLSANLTHLIMRLRVGRIYRSSAIIYSTMLFHQAMTLCSKFDYRLPKEFNDDVRRVLTGFDDEKKQSIYNYAKSMIERRR